MEFSEVEQARTYLREHLRPTRLIEAAGLSRETGARVFLKLESENPTGSFKIRGALVAMARRAQQGGLAGAVTSSTGNHGAAVAYAAQQMGVPATVFLPQRPNPVKRDLIARLGAEVVEAGRDYDAARENAAEFAERRGWYFVEDGRDSNLTPGPATISCEILEALPETDLIYVPVGDTTLIRGVGFAAKHLKPSVRLVGVQAERAPAYYRSWQQGRAVSTDSCDTLADGLAVRTTTEDNVAELRRLADEMTLVSEEEMLRAIRRLLLEEHIVAEPAGAATTAAFLKSGYAHAGKTVVLLVTGANLTPEILRHAVEQS
ncbi:MAG: threonine ammonia-lyase [Candidatus Acidiferrales bacterium]